MRILAIDPGSTESAYVLIESGDCSIIEFAKVANDEILAWLPTVLVRQSVNRSIDAALEMIASYGMAVGAEVFETCVWIGRFEQTIRDLDTPVDRVVRKVVKMHLCGNAGAKDSNIAQALKDRFAYGVSNHGKGTKDNPGWFYGFSADVWQAYALAVVKADQLEGRQ